MREYFYDILNNLDTLAGLRQLENIYRSVGDDRGKAITEINKLLDALCNVSKLFPFIPEAEQQKIINQAVISEEFPNLNANLVYKWLNRHKDKYFKESHHVPEEPAAPPLTGEARQAKLREWLDKLGAVSQPSPAMTQEEIKQEGKEWVSVIDKKSVAAGYRKTPQEEIEAKDLHIQYIRENYDPYTAKKLPTWISETEWLKAKGEMKK